MQRFSYASMKTTSNFLFKVPVDFHNPLDLKSSSTDLISPEGVIIRPKYLHDLTFSTFTPRR